jgi:copper transport protein
MRIVPILFALLLPLPAFAHAQLRATEPAEGAMLPSAPDRVTLEFNEPVAPLVLRWITPGGTVADLDGSVVNTTVTVASPDDLAEGTHLLTWRVMSVDGHPVGGTLTFHVVAPSTAPAKTAPAATGVPGIVAAVRFALTVALVCAVGIAVFAALVARSPASGAALWASTGGALLTPLVGTALLGAQGLDMLGLAPSALVTAAPWRAALGTSIVTTVALSVAAALLASRAVRTAMPSSRVALATGGWLLASASFAASGHAAAAPPRGLAMSAIAVHVGAVIFWMGSLLPLLVVLRGTGSLALLRRFASLAVPTVAALILSGVTLVWLQADDLQTLLGSAYGALLGAKVALVAGLLTLAARNRLILTPALAGGDPATSPRLARAIRAEIVLGLAILALASAFRLTPPPRALTEPAPPLFAHLHADRAMADVRLTPGRVGPVDVSIALVTSDFGELVPREVEVIFAQPDAGIEPIRIGAERRDDGLWHAGPASLPLAGEWEVTLRLLVTDFDLVTLTGEVKLED